MVRFPFPLLAAATATTAGLFLVDGGDRQETLRVLLAALLGLPTLTAIRLLAEERKWSPLAGTLAGIAVVGLAALFYQQAQHWPQGLLGIRFLQLALGTHLLVAVLPFQGRGESSGFWHFNRILFERFLLGGLYAVVLLAGLAVALAAIDRLLGVPIDTEVYPRLLVVVGFLFHPWYTLSGVPRDLRHLDQRDEYPLTLKVFAQYILIPIVGIYLVILTLYLGRVVITRVWPSGWIGYLVSSVALAGTLALLLVHPIRDRREGRWIDPFARWYFIALLPALMMLLLAVGQRINQYGITEPRYALAVLGWWYLIVSLFYTITRSKSIRMIPASLGLLALVTAIGPWGMTATARRSQIQRFARLAAGREAAAATGPAEDNRIRRELTAAARYLWEVHGAEGLAEAVRVPPDTVEAWESGLVGDPITLAVRAVGAEPLWGGRGGRVEEIVSFTIQVTDTSGLAGIPLAGESTLFAGGELFRRIDLTIGGDTVKVVPHRAAGLLEFRQGNLTAHLPIGAVLDSLAARGPGLRQIQRPTPIVIETAPAAPLAIRLVITAATWSKADSSLRSVTGAIIVSSR